MHINGIGDTGNLFLGGTIVIAFAVDQIVKHTAYESAITLLTTGSILLPLTALIGTVTLAIFEKFKWRNEIAFVSGIIFTLVSSTVITSGAAVSLGLTASLWTGWRVSFIALSLFTGLFNYGLGFENIFFGEHHQAFGSLRV